MEAEVERVGETNPTTSEIESLKSKIQTVEEALQSLKQGLGTFDRATILECIQTLEDVVEKVNRVGAPTSTNEEDGRSISRNQQIGAKEVQQYTSRKNLLVAPQTLPNPTLENYQEVQVGLGGNCQYVTRRRFGVCVAMA